jgi:hypothetical protein
VRLRAKSSLTWHAKTQRRKDAKKFFSVFPLRLCVLCVFARTDSRNARDRSIAVTLPPRPAWFQAAPYAVSRESAAAREEFVDMARKDAKAQRRKEILLCFSFAALRSLRLCEN